jgi:hypothetical protein
MVNPFRRNAQETEKNARSSAHIVDGNLDIRESVSDPLPPLTTASTAVEDEVYRSSPPHNGPSVPAAALNSMDQGSGASSLHRAEEYSASIPTFSTESRREGYVPDGTAQRSLPVHSNYAHSDDASYTKARRDILRQTLTASLNSDFSIKIDDFDAQRLGKPDGKTNTGNSEKIPHMDFPGGRHMRLGPVIQLSGV